jgi:hypothetical protein
MQTKFPHYVAPVGSNDEYSDEPTHCAFEVRPSVVWRITRYLLLSRLVQLFAKSCSEVRFYFSNINWMSFIDDDNLLDNEIVEKGGFADEDTIADLFNESESGLRGHEIQMYSEGTIRFICYHKHSGVEFFSDEIDIRELFDAMHFEHVIAEIEHQVLLYKARTMLRRIKQGFS